MDLSSLVKSLDCIKVKAKLVYSQECFCSEMLSVGLGAGIF